MEKGQVIKFNRNVEGINSTIQEGAKWMIWMAGEAGKSNHLIRKIGKTGKLLSDNVDANMNAVGVRRLESALEIGYVELEN